MLKKILERKVRINGIEASLEDKLCLARHVKFKRVIALTYDYGTFLDITTIEVA